MCVTSKILVLQGALHEEPGQVEPVLQRSRAPQRGPAQPLAGRAQRIPEDDHPQGHPTRQGQCNWVTRSFY